MFAKNEFVNNGHDFVKNSKQILVHRAKHDRDNPYLTTSVHLSQTTPLSPNAKAVLFYRLSRPTDWQLNVKDVSNHVNISPYLVYKALRELEGLGYLHRERIRGTRGRFTQYKYVFFEYGHSHSTTSPSPLPERDSHCTQIGGYHEENRSSEIIFTSESEAAETRVVAHSSPYLNPSHVVNSTLHINENIDINTLSPRARVSLNAEENPSTYHPSFDEFWSYYPASHRVNKERAYKEWLLVATTPEMASHLVNALRAQLQERTLKREHGVFLPEWKQAHGWLRDKRWKDVVMSAEEIVVYSQRVEKKSVARAPSVPRYDRTGAKILTDEEQAARRAKECAVMAERAAQAQKEAKVRAERLKRFEELKTLYGEAKAREMLSPFRHAGGKNHESS